MTASSTSISRISPDIRIGTPDPEYMVQCSKIRRAAASLLPVDHSIVTEHHCHRIQSKPMMENLFEFI
jgi:hypothetical protein